MRNYSSIMNTAAGIIAGLYDFNDTDIPKPYW